MVQLSRQLTSPIYMRYWAIPMFYPIYVDFLFDHTTRQTDMILILEQLEVYRVIQ